jgi:NitT/TauT family transport system substrate-binding protein
MKAVILAVSLSLPLSFSIASAQLTKMTVGYSAIGAVHFPAWMAKESGIFLRNGLDVQLVYFTGGTTAVMALLSREAPINQMAGPAIVSASLRGADTVMIAGGIVTFEQSLMSRPEIKSAAELKGGSVAIARFGGLTDFMTRIALQKLGLVPIKDVAIVQIGGLPERLSALEKGKVQAVLLGMPNSFMAEKGLSQFSECAHTLSGPGSGHDPKIYSGKSRSHQEVCQISDRGCPPLQDGPRNGDTSIS